jgi:hypothetical protein
MSNAQYRMFKSVGEDTHMERKKHVRTRIILFVCDRTQLGSHFQMLQIQLPFTYSIAQTSGTILGCYQANPLTISA